MPKEEYPSLDSYENFVREKIEPWSAAQRTALATAMAERWLPAYETFSKDEDWGDPAILRQSLNTIWDTLSGQVSTSVNWNALERQVDHITPHMDDFDANEALCACVMVKYAIQCCADVDNLMDSVMAVLSGLEAVRPDLLTGDRVPPRLWKQAAVHKEISKQRRLIEQIAVLTDVANARDRLQPFFTDPQIVGKFRPKGKNKPEPVGRTNRQVFEQYRKVIQIDIQGAARGLDPKKHPDLATILYLSAWMGRYSRRKQFLTGEYGPLADQTAVTLLFEKNRARDRAEPAAPNWEESIRYTINLCYQNKMNGLDADTPEEAHSYGPSLRQLWVKAKQSGLADDEAWDQILAWGRHQPESWQKKSKGKKGEMEEDPAALQAYLAQPLDWASTNNLNMPWTRVVDGDTWHVRLNDFPDEIMYSLLINGKLIGHFHDWPKIWRR